MSRPVKSLVPGRRILDEEHACAMLGYYVHHSYMDDKTIIENNETVADVMDDTMERALRKQGKTDWEIIEIKKEKEKRRDEKVRATVKAQGQGTQEFADLLKVFNYRPRPDENIREESDEEAGTSFAVPKPPSDQTRVQILSSTPKNPNQTMRSLRCLDISRVGNSETSFDNSVFKQPILPASKNPFADEQARDESLQGTFTKEKSGTSLQGTFSKSQNTASLQGTFTKEKDGTSLQGTFSKDQNTASLQGTFTKENTSESIQGTFTKNVDEDNQNEVSAEERTNGSNVVQNIDQCDNDGTFVVKPTSICAETSSANETTRNKSKTKLADREKRNISLASSMLESSMLNVGDSPGAKLFVSRPKKLRPSTESQNKSQTIQMESIHEEDVVEQSGATSYASPVTEQNMEDSTSDVSTRKSVNLFEKARDVQKIPQVLLDTKTPKRNYLKPTISSIQKSISHKTPISIVANRIPTSVSTPINISEQRSTSINDRLSRQFEEVPDEEENEESVGGTAVVTQGEPVNILQLSSSSEQQAVLNSIERTLDVLNLGETVGNISYNDGGIEHDEEEEDETEGPSRRNTSNQLLDGSLATVNTPGLFVRNRDNRYQKNNDTSIDDSFEEDSMPNSKKMVLAGRSLIKPQADDAGLRRSNRTRVKPLRPWLGEHAVYQMSPSGGKRLVGVTEVVITNRKMLKYKSADPKVILERQCQEREKKKERAAERRRKLASEHRRGFNLDTTQEDILTSDDEE